MGRRVSVVIPTLRRPRMLSRAVRACLDQDLPAGWQLEVVVAVSDAGEAADVDAARALEQDDARVRVVLAPARGAGAARNAAIAASTGEAIAFTDDDCWPDPLWLRHALGALEHADIVQGKTWAGEPAGMHDRSIWSEPPSWLWETCNLVVRREFAERAGPFNEAWNAEGRVGKQFGEDTEWGWRVVRAGARTAFVPAAVVNHAVFRRSFWGFLGYRWRTASGMPRVFRTAPEARRRYYRGHFLYRRHVSLSASAAALLLSVPLRVLGRRAWSRALFAAAVGFYLWPWRQGVVRGRFPRLSEMRYRFPTEVVDLTAAVYGAVRWRRLFF